MFKLYGIPSSGTKPVRNPYDRRLHISFFFINIAYIIPFYQSQ